MAGWQTNEMRRYLNERECGGKLDYPLLFIALWGIPTYETLTPKPNPFICSYSPSR